MKKSKCCTWPKRAINKTLFFQFINKPQEVHGHLPQHLKHLVLAYFTKTRDTYEIHRATDKVQGSLSSFLRKIKHGNTVSNWWQNQCSRVGSSEQAGKIESNRNNNKLCKTLNLLYFKVEAECDRFHSHSSSSSSQYR